MEVFINELSLEGQYHSDSEFEEALKVLIDLLGLLKQKISDVTVYRGEALRAAPTVQTDRFDAVLGRLTNKGFVELVKRSIFNESQDWAHSATQDNEANYFYTPDIDPNAEKQSLEIEKINRSSLSEVAERILQNPDAPHLVINFGSSRFEQSDLSHATVIKIKNGDKKELIEVLCFEKRDSLEAWLELEYNLSATEYDYNSTSPPTDKQTVLRDEARFGRTNGKCQGRIIYKEIATGYYWYVDNFHHGKSSEIEVFDAQGHHLGVANLDGNIDTDKKENGRKISV